MFCDAVNVSDQIERRSFNKRLAILNGLDYKFPKCQGTTVDVLINGIRVQDKHAAQLDDRSGFPVRLSKKAGRNGVKLDQAYSSEDFDALFIFLPDQKHFTLIPSHILTHYSVFKSTHCNGKSSIVCYLSDYKFKGIGRPPSFHWTSQFCFNWTDPDIEEKVSSLLQTCHRQDLY